MPSATFFLEREHPMSRHGTHLLLAVVSSSSLPLGCDAPDPRALDGAERDQAQLGQLIEAEDRTAEQGWSLRSNHSGYTGSGFMDAKGSSKGKWIEWSNLHVPVAGEYELTVRYANGSSDDRRADIIVNGKTEGSEAFAPTGKWSKWKTRGRTVDLDAGSNTIRIRTSTDSGGPNIDHLVLSGGEWCSDDGSECGPELGGTHPLDRGAGTKLRIASWNTSRGSIFPKTDSLWEEINQSEDYDYTVERTEGAERIITAIDADIWLFQETAQGSLPDGISPTDIDDKLRDYMDELTGDSWTVLCNGGGLCAMMHDGIVVRDACLDGDGFNAYMVELQDHGGASLLLLNTDLGEFDDVRELRDLVSRSDASAVVVGGDMECECASLAGIGVVDGIEHLPSSQWVDWGAPHIQDSLHTTFAPDEQGFPTSTHGDMWYPIRVSGQSVVGGVRGSADDHFLLLSKSGAWEPTHQVTLNTLILSKETLGAYGLLPLDVALEPKRYIPYFSQFMSTGRIDRIAEDEWDSGNGMSYGHLPIVLDLDFSTAQASSSGSLLCD